MLKTTLYLPAQLKALVEQVARAEGRSEAEVIRWAISDSLQRRRRPLPRAGLIDSGDPTWAATADERLDGFGAVE